MSSRRIPLLDIWRRIVGTRSIFERCRHVRDREFREEVSTVDLG